MSGNYKIMSKYIKDISGETPDIETYLYVKDYISKYTPYRGILLFHGLGSGKTCSSIAIAEGLKHDKKVIVLTLASLRTNYVKENQ